MIRTRSIALLATVVLGAAGMLTGLGLGAAATAAPADGMGDVVGLVKEKGGDYLLDVNVEAIDRHGGVAASALTYESDVDAGEVGFFRLELEPGKYRLVFTKDGYVTQSSATKVRAVEGDEVEFGTVALRAEPKRSHTVATLRDNRITTTERAKVVVSVDAVLRPTGQVTVKYGRKVVGTARLDAGDQGRVRVALDRLDRGTYPLKAYYGGNLRVAGSKSRELKLTVQRQRPHRPAAYRLDPYRPNLRAMF